MTSLFDVLERSTARVVSSGEVAELVARAFPGEKLPARASRSPRSWMHAGKTVLYLLIYYSGLFRIVHAARKRAGASRACILLYHRLNDSSEDALTTSRRRFAEHMIVLRKHYRVLPTSTLVEHVRTRRPFPGNAVAIHFDDCYRDVFAHAAPLLAAARFPAAVFVSSGFVDAARRFPHDASSPWSFENLSGAQVRHLAGHGFEVGSHTVNHVDLGGVDEEVVAAELARSKEDLEAIVHKPVVFFSFPYGFEVNTHPDLAALARDAGYRAMFSAYGGCVSHASDIFDLPRIGLHDGWRPLDLLMEIEGLSVSALRRRWARRVGTRRSMAPSSRPALHHEIGV